MPVVPTAFVSAAQAGCGVRHQPRTVTTDDMKRANCPARYWTAEWDKLPLTAAYTETLTHFRDTLPTLLDQGVGVYLWSPENGTGKTAVAALFVIAAIQHGYSAFFVRSSEMKEAVVENQRFDDTTTLRERLREVEILVIDDLGKEHKGASGFAEGLLEDVVRDRTQWRRSTFFTSNLNPKQLAGIYSADFADVLKECTMPVLMGGPDKGGKLWREEERQRLKALLPKGSNG